VGDILKMVIENQADIGSRGLKEDESVKFDQAYHPDEMLFEWGEIDEPGKETTQGPMKDVSLSSFEFVDFRKFLSIRKNGENFFTYDDKRHSVINKGKLVHEVLSLIETSGDLDKALKRVVAEGKLGSAEAEALKTELNDLFADPEIGSWFDGTYRVVNERNILTGESGIKRPDRIMIGNDRVVVVDYKSGDVESEKYKYQLQSYIRALKGCGFQHVSGYIWYTKTNKRVPV
jgi:CRISPR/Cas system-associated exonuclease Cas4 (RecB family)